MSVVVVMSNSVWRNGPCPGRRGRWSTAWQDKLHDTPAAAGRVLSSVWRRPLLRPSYLVKYWSTLGYRKRRPSGGVMLDQPPFRVVAWYLRQSLEDAFQVERRPPGHFQMKEPLGPCSRRLDHGEHNIGPRTGPDIAFHPSV